MTLREIKFNEIRENGYRYLSVRTDSVELAEGFIGEVLRSIPHLADREVVEQHAYFNEWVITIKPQEVPQ